VNSIGAGSVVSVPSTDTPPIKEKEKEKLVYEKI